MKKALLGSMFFLFAFFAYSQNYTELIGEGNHTVDYISQKAELHFDSVGRVRGTGYKPFKRWQYIAEREADENGYLKSPEYYYNELQNYNALNNTESSVSRTSVGDWEQMGPTYWNATSGWNPGVGRITALDIEVNNQDHIIVGGQTGGVWRTTDGGTTWSVLTDNLSNIDVYALTIDPLNANVYYWGSTSGNIFKSIDSGATWTLQGALPGGNVNKILIHPSNNQTMYASAEGGGIYKSTNGGSSWSIINNSATNGYDVEFKPGDPNTIYASGNQFFISTDGGNTFASVSGFSSGPKMIGVSPADSNVVYVLEASNSTFGGFYKSTNSGSSFVQLNHTKNYFGYDTNGNDNRGQAPRDMDIAVHPNDINDVHIGGINTWRSIDGGATDFVITSQWTPSSANSLNIGYCHADIDLMVFAGAGASAKLYVGSDGGIFKADNPTNVTSSYYTDLTPGLGIRQFYKIGVSQTDPVIVTGGSQDNGTSALRADGNWIDWLGADGMESFVDKNDPQVMYGTSQFGSLYKTVNGGSSRSNLINPAGNGNWNWVVPFEQDPTDSNTIYVAYKSIYKSTNGGISFNSISTNYSGNIDHFKIAPSNNQNMYFSIDGDFYRSSNGGGFWIQTPLNIGNSIINSISIHPNNPLKVAVAVNNSNKVYVTTNGGFNWSAIGWDLPNFVPLSLAWHNDGGDGLYVGMNYGVYFTTDAYISSGGTWSSFNNGLPNVRINELEVNNADGKLYAGTYGRGLWRTNVFDALSTDEFSLDDFALYPNPAKNVVSLKIPNITGDVQVRIYNTLGKLMYFDKSYDIDTSSSIDVSNFTSGVYFVKVNSKQGEMTRKLIVN